ncbi:MAG: FG-GAP-like repeat-containing protein, partial [Bacteroidia bacterium]|nr:FG-GAP-like repeat-containing protein [Bacteroidia bacterium]
MLPKVYSRKKQTINGNSYQFYLNDDKYGYQHQYVRNMVHLHSGLQGESIVPYREVGQMMGVFQTEWSWSPLFADVDNDGDRDLLITNGFPKDLTDKDFTNYKAQMYGYLASEEQVLARVPVVKVANFAYEQVGDLQFQDRTKAWGLDIPSFSNGASFVDLDNDGDLDYVVNNIDDPAFVYRNNDKSPGHFLDLKLSGEKPNTQAIGAKVEVWAGESYQFAELFLSRGYISSVSPVMHVGLGEQTLIDSVKVTWPGNKRQTFLTAVTVDQVLSLSQADSEPLPTSAPATHDGLFTKADGVITYTHIERDYIDFFQNQRILQHKFSQIGPCMAQGDINMDGLDDLVIGASDGAPTQVFLNLNGRFVWDSVPGISDSKVCSEADLVILDIDNDGDNDLIALAGGYATESDKAYLHYLYQNNGGSFERIPLPLPSFSASVVAPFDFDHDGDKDLFVGGRVVKGKFPQAPASYLLMNEAGTLAESGSTPFELGMVTDAIWSDYDQDGWEDLIITREWNSVLILKNNQGKGLSPASLPSLNQYHGLWTTIVAVDIDQDGDDDYVVGNLGQNHRFQIAEKTPMNLYAIDVDNNGTIDPITSAYWEDDMGRMTEYPVNYLDELAAQSPFFRQRFTSYTQFSQTSIPLIFKPDSISSDQKLFVNTTSHYLLRNEDGKFRWEELPRSVQVAPIKEMLVRDFTGDNIPDVLITGNDYSYDVSTGNYDANRGLILAGTAGGSYRVIPASESGLAISGQVESIAYIEGDTSFLMLGINRQKMAVYRVGN